MKHNYLYTSLILLCLSFFLIRSSGGRAGSANSGNTGAPGDATVTCETCHTTGNNFGTEVDIDFTDMGGNSIKDVGYVPGETYQGKVIVTPTTGDPAGFGFQLVCLDCLEAECDGNSTDIKNWANPRTGVSIEDASNGRTYVEHNKISSSNEFTFDWAAPDVPGVTFYFCGNAVNGNGSTSGDEAICSSFELLQAVSSTGQITKLLPQMQLTPNPATDFVQVRVLASEAGDYSLRLFSQTGSVLYEEGISLFGKEEQIIRIPLHRMPSGMYFVQLAGKRGTVYKKLIN